MAVLEGIEPKAVFKFFEEICSFPHGSGNTKALSDFLVDFAKSRQLEYYQDSLNNVIIIKEATKGYEEKDAVILQGHIDMVCEKAPECALDMETEGLVLKVDGDFISAQGTTLGGDDGIAVAMALAILDSDTVAHPRIEAVFTVDEEIGMIGANALDVSPLCGKTMINIDSEEEGVFTVSCAGGLSAVCTLPVQRADFSGEFFQITVGGLLGGHSGVEIDKGRGNSNMLMGRILYSLSTAFSMRLVSVSGGLKDNAIPRETCAVIAVENGDNIEDFCDKIQRQLQNEYSITDPNVFVSVTKCHSGLPMDEESGSKAIMMLLLMPGGIVEMSADIKGLVQTSLNMGILTTDENSVAAQFALRSSVESQKEMLKLKLRCFMENIGGKVEYEGDYAGWEYRKESLLREIITQVYKEQYGQEPKIEAIHAGLECGVFAGKIDDFDGISIGPDIKDIHTFSERLSISSTERVYKMLVEVLGRMK